MFKAQAMNETEPKTVSNQNIEFKKTPTSAPLSELSNGNDPTPKGPTEKEAAAEYRSANGMAEKGGLATASPSPSPKLVKKTSIECEPTAESAKESNEEDVAEPMDCSATAEKTNESVNKEKEGGDFNDAEFKDMCSSLNVNALAKEKPTNEIG